MDIDSPEQTQHRKNAVYLQPDVSAILLRCEALYLLVFLYESLNTMNHNTAGSSADHNLPTVLFLQENQNIDDVPLQNAGAI